MEFGIEAVLREQLLMRALLHDIPLANNKNYICLPDRTQTMSDNEARSPFERFAHRFLHERFGVRIDRRGCLIEHDDRRIREHGTGDREQLALTLREIRSVFLDDRVVAIGQKLDEMIGLRELGSQADVLLLRVFRP